MVGSCVVLTMRLVPTGICFSLLLGFQAAFGRLGQPETLFGVANGFAVCVVLGRQSVGGRLLSLLSGFAGFCCRHALWSGDGWLPFGLF